MFRTTSLQRVFNVGRACSCPPPNAPSSVQTEAVFNGIGRRSLADAAGKGKEASSPVTSSSGAAGTTPPPASAVPSTAQSTASSTGRLFRVLAVTGGLAAGAYYVHQEYPEQTRAALVKLGVDPSQLDRLPEMLPQVPDLPEFLRFPQTKQEPKPQQFESDGWRLETATESGMPSEKSADILSETPATAEAGAADADGLVQKVDAAPLDQLLTDALTFTSVATLDQAAEESKASGQATSTAQGTPVTDFAVPATEPLQPPTAGYHEATEPLPKSVHPHGAQGVLLDLSPGGLVKYAVEHGHGPGGDWKAYDAQFRQAKADAVAIAEGLKQANQFAEEALQKERDITEHWKGKAEEIRSTAEEVVTRMKDIITLQGRHHSLLLQDAVRQAKLEATTAAAEAGSSERVHRIQRLDTLRQEANALGATLEAVGKTAQAAGNVNRTVLSLLQLQSALQRGQPFARHLSTVQRVAGGDEPLVRAAVDAVAGEVSEAGVPTKEQLAVRLNRLKAPLGELATLPASGGGILSRLAAKLTHSLKADEAAVVAASGLGAAAGSPDAALAAAEELLEAGKLVAAADVLEIGLKGTAAELEVAGWVEAARKRAAADVTAQLLAAHAAALASTVTAA